MSGYTYIEFNISLGWKCTRSPLTLVTLVLAVLQALDHIYQLDNRELHYVGVT